MTAALLLTAACSSSASDPHSNEALGKSSTPTAPSSAAGSAANASAAFKTVATAVPTAHLTGTVTAENDPNHLLGRPNQYTSKVTFSDSRVPAGDTSHLDATDIGKGGAIEAFATPADAEARAKYVQAVTKSMPALAEYDYQHGTILIRVSHFLTPAQAAAYKTAADKIS
ncbi:hypothetical protein [Streptantibioticus cattleyicolor]|nr:MULTISPECIES: hypothetical protein [Streptomycetaceae]